MSDNHWDNPLGLSLGAIALVRALTETDEQRAKRAAIRKDGRRFLWTMMAIIFFVIVPLLFIASSLHLISQY